RQLAYWKQQLAGAPPVLELPLDHPRPVEPAYRGTHYSFSLPAELLSELKKLSLRENATLFMVLLSAFQVLLARYSGQQDILVGVPVTERGHVEFENLIGCFVNTLVLRGDLQGNPTYREFLGRVRKATLEAYAYAAVPLEQLVATLQPERSRHISPFFQVMFVMDRDTWFQSDLPGLTVTPFDVESGISK